MQAEKVRNPSACGGALCCLPLQWWVCDCELGLIHIKRLGVLWELAALSGRRLHRVCTGVQAEVLGVHHCDLLHKVLSR